MFSYVSEDETLYIDNAPQYPPRLSTRNITHLLADDLPFVLVHELEQRDDHRQTKSADQDVEDASDVAQRQSTL